MSYILDALKKAEAQRERGAVPGLHSQAVAAMTGRPARGGGGGARSWVWVLSAAGVLVACGLAWLVWSAAGREPTRPSATASVPVAAAPVSAAAALAASAPDAPAAPLNPSVTPAAPWVPPLATGSIAAQVRPSIAAQSALTAPRVVAPTRTASAAAHASAAASEPRVYSLQDLPEDIRRELPTLAISGSMYSPDPANRMVIINGQVFHERDAVAPGLALAQIKLKAAVLDYKGYRYSISY